MADKSPRAVSGGEQGIPAAPPVNGGELPDGAVWEPLGARSRGVYRLPGCSFGEDALALARFAVPRPEERVCDLGTGTGVLPLYWYREPGESQGPSIDAVELDPTAAALARRAVREGGLLSFIRVWEADLRALEGVLPAGAYDRVTCNPPYFYGKGAFPSDPGSAAARRRLARQEGTHSCTLDQVLAAAARLLKNGGRFLVCHRPERLTDLVSGLRAHGLEPKRLRLLLARPGDTAPWLLLCEARKGGRPGLSVELCVKGEDAP